MLLMSRSRRIMTSLAIMHWCFASYRPHIKSYFSSGQSLYLYGQNISSSPVDSLILKKLSPLTSYILPFTKKSGWYVWWVFNAKMFYCRGFFLLLDKIGLRRVFATMSFQHGLSMLFLNFFGLKCVFNTVFVKACLLYFPFRLWVFHWATLTAMSVTYLYNIVAIRILTSWKRIQVVFYAKYSIH